MSPWDQRVRRRRFRLALQWLDLYIPSTQARRTQLEVVEAAAVWNQRIFLGTMSLSKYYNYHIYDNKARQEKERELIKKLDETIPPIGRRRSRNEVLEAGIKFIELLKQGP